MALERPPEIVVDPDWEVVELPFHIGSGRTLYSNLEQSSRLRLRVFRRKSNGHLAGRVWFGDGTDGPPGFAHGGSTAYILDEAMGSVAWANYYPVVAAKLEFEYFHLTPLFVDLTIEGSVDQVSPRSIEVSAKLIRPDGQICVQGRGNFARLTRDKMARWSDPKLDPKGLIKNLPWKWPS